jgi:hypothetical protein
MAGGVSQATHLVCCQTLIGSESLHIVNLSRTFRFPKSPCRCRRSLRPRSPWKSTFDCDNQRSWTIRIRDRASRRNAKFCSLNTSSLTAHLYPWNRGVRRKGLELQPARVLPPRPCPQLRTTKTAFLVPPRYIDDRWVR